MSDQGMSKKTTARKKRRVLAASQKYAMWVALLTGQGTQRKVAAKYGVDRSTVVLGEPGRKRGALAALAARPGRPGMSPEQVELAEAKAEIETVGRDGDRAGGGFAPASGKATLGLSAGPIPARVDAPVKVGLLDLAHTALTRPPSSPT